jgi:hypothetical protein
MGAEEVGVMMIKTATRYVTNNYDFLFYFFSYIAYSNALELVGAVATTAPAVPSYCCSVGTA